MQVWLTFQTEALSSSTVAYNNRDNKSNTTKNFYSTIIQQKNGSFYIITLEMLLSVSIHQSLFTQISVQRPPKLLCQIIETQKWISKFLIIFREKILQNSWIYTLRKIMSDCLKILPKSFLCLWFVWSADRYFRKWKYCDNDPNSKTSQTNKLARF